jgi:hypothetical protein
MSSGRPVQKDVFQPCRPLSPLQFLHYLKGPFPICRMLLWHLRLYSHRSSWFEIIAAVFCDLNVKRLLSLDQDDDLDARLSYGAQEGEASQ